MLTIFYKDIEINTQLKITLNLQSRNITFNLIKNRYIVKLIYPF
jgi:hypothetical protein